MYIDMYCIKYYIYIYINIYYTCMYQIIPYSKINDKCFLNVPSYLEGVQLVLLLCYYLFTWICCSDLFK